MVSKGNEYEKEDFNHSCWKFIAVAAFYHSHLVKSKWACSAHTGVGGKCSIRTFNQSRKYVCSDFWTLFPSPRSFPITQFNTIRELDYLLPNIQSNYNKSINMTTLIIYFTHIMMLTFTHLASCLFRYGSKGIIDTKYVTPENHIWWALK